MKNLSLLLKIAAVLYLIWGIVHVMIGIVLFIPLFKDDPVTTIHAITDKVDLATLQIDYPDSVTAILKQHSWNLLWFGAVVFIGSLYVWKKNAKAIFLCALVGGLADLGYFVFVDLADLASPPGPQMTWIMGAAIILSFYVYFKSDKLKSL